MLLFYSTKLDYTTKKIKCYNTIILQYYNTIILQYYNNKILKTTILQPTILQYPNTEILQYYYTGRRAASCNSSLLYFYIIYTTILHNNTILKHSYCYTNLRIEYYTILYYITMLI